MLERAKTIFTKEFFKNIFKEWGIPIICAIAVSFLVTKFLIFTAYIPSESMKPTLNVDDRLLVTRIYNRENIKNGEILVFKNLQVDDERLIKRVIGIPGDEISIKDGVVSVNGNVLSEEYVKYESSYTGEFKVPEGKYFFLGDNRSNSKDSRIWINPYVDGDDIIGRAQIKIYPFKDFGFIK